MTSKPGFNAEEWSIVAEAPLLEREQAALDEIATLLGQ